MSGWILTVSKAQIVSSSCYNKCYPFCPIEAALLRMTSHLYPLGEGIIGKVALTGRHCWISAHELSSRSMHKYQEDWQLQFAAGIKTVLLVPVVPHGVLQLGSLDKVFENINLFEMDSSAKALNDHLSLTHPLSTAEFPISEDITIDSYRTSTTGWPNELLDGNGTMEYEYFNGFTLTNLAHRYQEDTCGDGSTVLNDGVVISNSSIHSEFHRDLMTVSREEHELFMWHSHAMRLDELSVPEIPGGQELPPIHMNENEGFRTSAMTGASPTEINKTITEECIVRNTMGTNSAEIKKRRRKVELQRSRPRDRQLIQDRMKGLRELIPNASKCSIDALLDKTIGYMLFLQSVSEKAEKNTLENKEFCDETKKQLESYPLRVEELDQPGHLLIEMLCEDYEVFLEMAHALKGLEVSILKGVLEHRSDKLWAHVVIKASGGFSQTQILCPLMHLLHRRWS
ncbi:unnamed protein product [Urochloa decumbens]|uniref:BHLH domain-containing protein n=1 Tax=Urochloa decumbens TaxID=240449 RepID=A0ABC9HA03_9POAL